MPGRSQFSGIAQRYRPGGYLQTKWRRLISRGGVCWCGRIFRHCVRLDGGWDLMFFRCRSCWGGRGWLGCRRIGAFDGFREKPGGALVKVRRRSARLSPAGSGLQSYGGHSHRPKGGANGGGGRLHIWDWLLYVNTCNTMYIIMLCIF